MLSNKSFDWNTSNLPRGALPIRKTPNHEAEYKIYAKTNQNWVVDVYYKLSGERYGEQTFREFNFLLIEEIKRGRRHGYVCLWLYPHEGYFLENDKKYIAIFIRRYFYDSTVTGFGQQYNQLFDDSYGNLEGIWVGFHQLNKAILKVIVETNPLRWAWSIGIFALTFSESVRFIWFEEEINRLMEQEWNLPMTDRLYYMSELPTLWLVISNCARRTLRWNEPNEPQPPRE
ncbi:symplekin isoform X2 [Tanacetum coccineum]